MIYTTHKNGDEWGMVYSCYTNITSFHRAVHPYGNTAILPSALQLVGDPSLRIWVSLPSCVALMVLSVRCPSAAQSCKCVGKCVVPSGNLLHSCGKSQFLMGKMHYQNGHVQ